LQLAHGGGQCSPAITGEPTLAPSSIKPKNYPTRPAELNQEQIELIINSFVDAIERSQKAGFSGVQLHGAHGYLLSEFLSPFYNRRQDQWGGNTENRYRIVGEIIHQARKRSGTFPIWIKINAQESIRNGMRLEESIKIARLLEKSGCDAIEVSRGASVAFDTVRVKDIPIEAAIKLNPRLSNLPPIKKITFKLLASYNYKQYTPLYNYNVEAAQKIKGQVSVPIIVVGGIRRLQDIEEIIQQEKADYVALSRPFIIEPDIVAKFASGKQDESRCIDCGYCLLGLGSNPLHCYYGKIPAKYRG
jgi:2,4-dienoyl-CoA reductase-like NADH-dependent reductase (Old Yellow Enzyme family)